MQQRAFSLVELSIVLVILGLLVGGILAGQSLVHASELRSSLQQIESYKVAFSAFHDKYFALPGDFSQGYQVFANGNNAVCGTNAASMSGCNGDGNSLLDATTRDHYRAWMHLQLAGLINENISFQGSYGSAIFGTTAPRSKYRGGYTLHYTSPMMEWTAQRAASVVDAVLKPEDAWNIDTKLDDGKPNSGKVIGVLGTASDGSCGTTDYQLTNSGIACVLNFYAIY